MGIETLAIASLAGSVLSAGVGAIGAMSQGAAQEKTANYQAAVARNNAIIQQQNAAGRAAAGRAQAQVQDMKNAQIMGRILADQAAGGIDLGTGTPTQVRQSAETIGRLDTLTIADKARQEVRGYNILSEQETAQAQLDTMQASQAKTASYFNAASSILGASSQFADKWMRFSTTGVPGFA